MLAAVAGIRISTMLVLAASVACGPKTSDDAGSDGSTGDGEPTAGSAPGATETGITAPGTDDAATTDPDGSDTSMPVDCNALDGDQCGLYGEQCETVSGTEALPTGRPGEYDCSDAKAPFGCAPLGCEEMDSVVVCKLDDPSTARWVVNDCLPGGWEECPGGMCV